jgi:glutathione S-transferase
MARIPIFISKSRSALLFKFHSTYNKDSLHQFAMATKEQPAITLYRGFDDRGKYVWSPFVTKLEFRLRTSSTPYKAAIGSPGGGPKGKIPYVEVTEPNQPAEWLSDSSLILQTLVSRGIADDLNAGLSPAQKGQDLAIRALLEDKLYFYTGHERWVKNYYTMRDHVLSSIPYLLRIVVGLLAYRGNVKKLHDQGAGRFSDGEIRGFVKEIWGGINGMLSESRRKAEKGRCFWVLGGEEPTEADATLFGFVTSTLVCEAGPESRALLKREFPVVLEWAEKVHERWFPDYEMWA